MSSVGCIIIGSLVVYLSLQCHLLDSLYFNCIFYHSIHPADLLPPASALFVPFLFFLLLSDWLQILLGEVELLICRASHFVISSSERLLLMFSEDYYKLRLRMKPYSVSSWFSNLYIRSSFIFCSLQIDFYSWGKIKTQLIYLSFSPKWWYQMVFHFDSSGLAFCGVNAYTHTHTKMHIHIP